MSTCAEGCEVLNTGNDILILHEIRHALDKLLNTGEVTTIDLRSIPMAPGEEAKIEETLGKGEISVKLDALGTTTIIETGISGVWLITHFNAEDEILSKFIDITLVPALVQSPKDEVVNSLQVLSERLAG